MIIANYFFFYSLSFILGIFLSFYIENFIFIFILILIFLGSFLISKNPIFSLFLIIFCFLGYYYSIYFSKFILSKNSDYVILERKLASTTHQRFLGYYKGNSYIVYLPYYLKVYPKYKIYGDFEIIEDKIFFKNIKKIEKPIFYPIYELKEKINELIYKNYSPNSSEIISGILYGEEIKDFDIRNSLKESGLSHITAMSGFNLTIIAILVNNLLKILVSSIFLKTILSIVFIILFIIFTEFQSSVIRAGIMVIFFILAKAVGRIPLKRNILILPLILISIINPLSLLKDLSFHLSFLAVLGIFYLEDYFTKIFKFKTIGEIISAQIMVAPYIWYKFGEMNIFSFLNNLLIVPIIPFLMLIGFLAIFLIPIKPLALVLNYPFEIFVKIIQLLSKFPKVNIEIPLILVLILYISIFYLIYLANKNENIDFNFALS